MFGASGLNQSLVFQAAASGSIASFNRVTSHTDRPLEIKEISDRSIIVSGILSTTFATVKTQ